MIPFEGVYLRCVIGIHKWTLMYEGDGIRAWRCERCRKYKWKEAAQ